MVAFDFDMSNVKPQADYSELPIGKYLMRIGKSEKKGTKDKFDEAGNPSPDNGKNFYLNIPMTAMGGPEEGHVEFERLNLWNSNITAVNIARSTLKSIFAGVGFESNDSDHLEGQYVGLEVKARLDGKGTSKHYFAIPREMIPADAPPPPIPGQAPPAVTAGYAAAHAPAPASQHFTATPAGYAPAAAPAAGVPDWMKKK